MPIAFARRCTLDMRQFRAAAAGQTIVVGARRPGGKSELRRAVRRVTPGQGNSKESGTENIPLTGVAASRPAQASKGEKVR